MLLMLKGLIIAVAAGALHDASQFDNDANDYQSSEIHCYSEAQEQVRNALPKLTSIASQRRSNPPGEHTGLCPATAERNGCTNRRSLSESHADSGSNIVATASIHSTASTQAADRIKNHKKIRTKS